MDGKVLTACCCVLAVFVLLASNLQASELLRTSEMEASRDMVRKRLVTKKIVGDKGHIVVPMEEAKAPAGKVGKPHYRKGEVLVRFRKGIKAHNVVKGMKIAEKLTVRKKFHVLSRIKGKDYMVVKAKGMTAAELMSQLKKDPNVEAVSLNYAKYLNTTIPNDNLFVYQWPLDNIGQEIYAGYSGTPDADIDGPEAWDIQTGSEEVIVAVLDTGVDYLHPDLDDNMWVNQQEAAGAPGVDDDGNGYIDDIYGIDTGRNDADPMDVHGHGTHVAGTIAAEGNNNLGVAGVNWNAKIMAVQGFAIDGYMYTDAEVEALEYIIVMKQRGVNIVAINASYGCYACYDQFQKDAIEAAGDEGIIFVGAAGNDGTNNDTEPHYPSSYNSSNIISVAATDWDDGLASFSNYGISSVDLGAPGDYVLSTYLDMWYTPGQGGDFFFDNMESGSGKWTAEGTWAITEEEALSPTQAWSDSPGGDYVKNAEYSLTSNPIDLSGSAGHLSMGLAVKYDLEDDFDYLDLYYKSPPLPSYWGRTIEESYSGSYAWSDSPGGNYTDGAYSWLISPVIDISGADDGAKVSFFLTGVVEENYDFLRIYFSADGGTNWAFLYSLTGDESSMWSGFSGVIPSEFRTSRFRVAFVLYSDDSINEDGYYIDDVKVVDSLNTFFIDDIETGINGWETPEMPRWDYIGSITGNSGGYWYLFNISIDDKYLWDQFQVRYVLSADNSINHDGVYLDDIGIGASEIDHVYAYMSGTSMAVPHVSGAVALMAAEYTSETIGERIGRILSGVDPLAALTGQVAYEGRLNLYNSLTIAPCEGDFEPDGDVDGSDLAILAADFGRTDCAAAPQCNGDLDGDGDVDGSDLAVFAADFGRTDCPLK